MWILLLAASASAAPDGYKVSKQTDSCTLYLGPPMSNGVVPVHAECAWPDVSYDKLTAMFSVWADHDLFFETVVSSDVERTEGDATFVRQVHRTKGISDREVVLKMTKTPSGGGLRFAWTLDTQPFTVAEGNVAPTWDVGWWEFSPRAEGGTTVGYHLEYDPGGSVPGFLVRWFQVSGIEAVLNELEAYAKGH